MPLRDHFHPPLSVQRHWESFHATWAGAMADALNDRGLPTGYFAEEQTHPTARVEIDVAAYEELSRSSGVVSTAPDVQTWRPAAPTWTLTNSLPEGTEVLVFQQEGGPTLVGAIELISPANKDRPASRRAFATKCASYLHQGVGLVLVDVVSSRTANLHDDLVSLLEQTADGSFPKGVSLYAVAYRPVRRDGQDVIETWPQTLAVGENLPTLPLWLGADVVIPLDLESTYQDASRRRRLP